MASSRADLALAMGRVILSREEYVQCLGGSEIIPIVGIVEQEPQLQYNDTTRKSSVRFYVAFIEPALDVSARDDHFTVMCNVSDPPFAGMGYSFVKNIRVGDAIVFQGFKLPNSLGKRHYVWSRNGSNLQWYRLENDKLLSQRAGGEFSSTIASVVEKALRMGPERVSQFRKRRIEQDERPAKRQAQESQGSSAAPPPSSSSSSIPPSSSSIPEQVPTQPNLELRAVLDEQKQLRQRIEALESQAAADAQTYTARISQLETDFADMYRDVETLLAHAVDKITQAEEKCQELERILATK